MTAALLLLVALATPIATPPRSATEQTHLTALADGLGHAHALHQLCAGRGDDLWRARMGRLITVERPDPGLKQRLTDAFNTGFATGKAAFSTCSPQSREALADVERRTAVDARALGPSKADPDR